MMSRKSILSGVTICLAPAAAAASAPGDLRPVTVEEHPFQEPTDFTSSMDRMLQDGEFRDLFDLS